MAAPLEAHCTLAIVFEHHIHNKMARTTLQAWLNVRLVMCACLATLLRRIVSSLRLSMPVFRDAQAVEADRLPSRHG